MAGALKIPDERDETPAPDPVKCASCVYFRGFEEIERRELNGLVGGDGFCYADPPTPSLAVEPGAVGPPKVTLRAIRPPVKYEDRCRYWRAEFAGDAAYPAAEALENIAEDLAALVQYARESVQLGRGGKA